MVIEQVKSVIESILFAASKPVAFSTLKEVFKESDVDPDMIQDAINRLSSEMTGGDRGVHVEEVAGGYQIRTKNENADFIRKMVKGRPFRLSGPAMEVLSIVAYKQPVVKAEVDQIRGVESSHLLRALMEKSLVKFAGKSELPGKPMLYSTTKEFLELFGLRSIRELPTLSEIDELLPEGMGQMTDVQEVERETLGTLADKIGLPMGKSYSESEEELLSISEDIASISSTTEFFEKEKQRQKEERERERAQDVRERMIVGELVGDQDKKWLERYDRRMEQIAAAALVETATASSAPHESTIQGGEAAEDYTNVISLRDREISDEGPVIAAPGASDAETAEAEEALHDEEPSSDKEPPGET